MGGVGEACDVSRICEREEGGRLITIRSPFLRGCNLLMSAGHVSAVGVRGVIALRL